jgi:hypothetical protein
MHARRLLLLQAPTALLALALLGCSVTNQAPGPGPTPDSPALLPDDRVEGRVVTVNPALRYVVIDFGLRHPPGLGQHLVVYRQGVKVGEVKVTGPMLGSAGAGDILSGQAAVGDIVREE